MSEFSFHERCGTNIRISEDHRAARRATSYNNGVCFSNRPIEAGEVFTIQIDETETGWEGHLRVGLTSFDPSTALSIPEFALPNLLRVSHCSMTVIRQTTELDAKFHQFDVSDQPSTSRVRSEMPEICGHFHSPYNNLNRRDVIFSPSGRDCDRLPTDVGSRISIFYTIDRQDQQLPIKVQILINGKSISRNAEPYDDLLGIDRLRGDEQNRYTTQALPLAALPLFVVIDIYANTKQVHVVNDFEEPHTLQEICRNVIRLRYPLDRQIAMLPCPLPLKYFLRRNEQSPMDALEILRMRPNI